MGLCWNMIGISFWRSKSKKIKPKWKCELILRRKWSIQNIIYLTACALLYILPTRLTSVSLSSSFHLKRNRKRSQRSETDVAFEWVSDLIENSNGQEVLKTRSLNFFLTKFWISKSSCVLLLGGQVRKSNITIWKSIFCSIGQGGIEWWKRRSDEWMDYGWERCRLEIQICFYKHSRPSNEPISRRPRLLN